MARKKKKTLTDAEIAQVVADAADTVERGGRSSGIRIGDSRFHLEGRQLGTETTETTEGTEVPIDADTMSVDPPAAPLEGTAEPAAQTPSHRRSTRTRTQVTPRPEGQRRGGRPPSRVRGTPPVKHFDLRGATARQVQSLRFVEVSRWFPPQRDSRASEGFYTPLQEDFYRALVDSGIAFRPQRVCRIESLIEVVGEQLCPHLSYLSGLSDFLGWIGAYYDTWVREFYASLWIDPAHEFIHFAFRGHDRRLYSSRVREILRLPALDTKIHQLCFGQTAPPRRPHGGSVPPTDLI
jgi:hypothetical protein